MIRVAQCWDDGVTTDVRLTDILRKHHAKATFNLCIGKHGKVRTDWSRPYKGTPVAFLAEDELLEVYDGFQVANHSQNHCNLAALDEQTARRELIQGKDGLEQLFGKAVLGFVYPFGKLNDSTAELVAETGHSYGRLATKGSERFSISDGAYRLSPTCQFSSQTFWRRYEEAKPDGVFYFWGHSYEMVTEEKWSAFERMIEQLSSEATWVDVLDLVTQ